MGSTLYPLPMFHSWSPPPADITLGSNQVDVWRACLDLSDSSLKALESSLSEEEILRSDRFYFQADRNRFIAAHGFLRDVLARYIHQEPAHLVFSAEPYGKPTLSADTNSQKLSFNLSHSGSIALAAVAYKFRVGVDVEHIRSGVFTLTLAQRYFSIRETQELMEIPVELQEVAFFTYWTRKEAYVKAQGLGLSLGLDTFEVSLASDKPPILRAISHDSQRTEHWTLHHLDVGSGYSAALAVEGKGLEIRLWEWN